MKKGSVGGSHFWKCLWRYGFGEELKILDFAWGGDRPWMTTMINVFLWYLAPALLNDLFISKHCIVYIILFEICTYHCFLKPHFKWVVLHQKIVWLCFVNGWYLYSCQNFPSIQNLCQMYSVVHTWRDNFKKCVFVFFNPHKISHLDLP